MRASRLFRSLGREGLAVALCAACGSSDPGWASDAGSGADADVASDTALSGNDGNGLVVLPEGSATGDGAGCSGDLRSVVDSAGKTLQTCAATQGCRPVGRGEGATNESAAHDTYKAALVRATESETMVTELFDVGWPGAPHRTLINSTVAAWVAAGRSPPGQRRGEADILGAFADGTPIRRYEDVTPTSDVRGDVEAMALYAGTSVRGVTRVESAQEVVAALSTGMSFRHRASSS
jgi:nitronate monooxygenase